MAVSKGLKCPVVALPGVGHMPAEGEMEAARVFMWRRDQSNAVCNRPVAAGQVFIDVS